MQARTVTVLEQGSRRIFAFLHDSQDREVYASGQCDDVKGRDEVTGNG